MPHSSAGGAASPLSAKQSLPMSFMLIGFPDNEDRGVMASYRFGFDSQEFIVEDMAGAES